MEYKPTRQGYMTIREAAATYEVSRAKIHRLIRLGRLPTEKDPKDRRATLLKAGDLEATFRFPGEDPMRTNRTAGGGVLTAELRARVDALRTRLAAGGDSVETIREARQERSTELYEGSGGHET